MRRNASLALCLILAFLLVDGVVAPAQAGTDLVSGWTVEGAALGLGAGPTDDAGWDLKLLTVGKRIHPRIEAHVTSYRYFPNPFPSFWFTGAIHSPLWWRSKVVPSRFGGRPVTREQSLSAFAEGSFLPAGEKRGGDFYEVGMEMALRSGNVLRIRVSWVWISIEREEPATWVFEPTTIVSTGSWAGPRVILSVGFLNWVFSE